MSIDMRDAPDVVAPDRLEMMGRLRAELREQHSRLTDRQIDLIAEVAVEIRLTSHRMLERFEVAQHGESIGR
jgi:hypothetical protein